MKILDKPIRVADLAQSDVVFDGPMVKGAVDVERGLLAIDADLHADLERLLLENGSEQDNIWGINLWYEDGGEDLVEFDSMINVRPRQNNRSRDVENSETRQKIIEIVQKWIQ